MINFYGYNYNIITNDNKNFIKILIPLILLLSLKTEKLHEKLLFNKKF